MIIKSRRYIMAVPQRILRLRQRFPGLVASKRRRVIELILMADEATGNTGLAELVLATDYEGGHG